ncbi:MAG: toll/interleukin-1 receptor domain-containing protein [Caldimonas sp.]
MREAQIFISYRREDAAGYARAIYDELARRFGADRVFMDVDDIAAGQPFDEAIRRAVGASSVLLVLIGRRWLGEREGTLARINEPGDFVRQEVAAGLARGMRVIPLLLDGATMPTEAQLPDELRALSRRNALELDNARFAADIERLTGAVRQSLGEAPRGKAAPGTPMSTPASTPALWRWPLAAALVATAAGLALWLARSPQRPLVNGAWQATVVYDWPNARYDERFEFSGSGDELAGKASFLGVARGVLEGSLRGDELRFTTRTSEMSGAALVHRYAGRLVGDDEIRFTLQTEGGDSSHVPVEFVASRAGPATARTSR